MWGVRREMKDEKVELNTLISSRLLAKAKRVCTEKHISLNQFIYRAFKSYMNELEDREYLKDKLWQRYVFRNLPKRCSKEEEVLKYLLNNRIEGARQVYSMPDLLEKCSLSLDEAAECLSNVFQVQIDEDKGFWIGGLNPITSLYSGEDFVELRVYRFGWEMLATHYCSVDPKEPSEEVKQIIAYLDSEEVQAERAESRMKMWKAFEGFLFGAKEDER